MSDTRHPQPHDSRPPGHSTQDEEGLFLKYATALRRIVGARVNTSDANLDDACGFAWTQLLAKQPRRDSVFAWLLTVATREALRLHRLMQREGGGGDDLALDELESPTAGATPAKRIQLDEVSEALERIHPRRRTAMLLHAVGFTYEEIASEYGVSVERARALVYQARLQLRAQVDLD